MSRSKRLFCHKNKSPASTPVLQSRRKATILGTLFVILWKNFIIYKRHFIWNFFEVIFPPINLILLLEGAKLYNSSTEIWENNAKNLRSMHMKESESVFISEEHSQPGIAEEVSQRTPVQTVDGGMGKVCSKDVAMPYSDVSYAVELGYTLLVGGLIYRIAKEKETGLKEHMKIMGLTARAQWIGWFLYSLQMHVFSTMFFLALLLTPWREKQPLMRNSSVFLVWLIFIFFIMAVTIFCFMFPAFFVKAKYAVLVGVIVWSGFHSGLLSALWPFHIKTGTSLSPITAVGYSMVLIGELENRNVGLQWSNLFSKVRKESDWTVGSYVGILFANILLFAIVTWYLDNIFPGDYGIARPWYFVFKFCKRSKDDKKKSIVTSPEIEPTTSVVFDVEAESSEQPSRSESASSVGTAMTVEAIGLRKTYRRRGREHVVAVEDFTISLYKGEITVLLGHNGCGKSTTINILTGLCQPTDGVAYVGGYSVTEQLTKVRTVIGLCPQYSILIQEFTVWQHFVFFAMLRGDTRKEAKQTAKEMIRKLRLFQKSHVVSRNLSESRKRMLSVGISLIAGSEVVLLDEPTTGLDPQSKRLIWDALQEGSSQRTILMTTHSMREAEILADRIAIMARGKVYCYGTVSFLRGLYDSGYHVIISGDSIKKKKVTKIIKGAVPTFSVADETDTGITYFLPFQATHTFQQMFKKLEERKESLGIEDWRISASGLQNIFIRVVREAQRTSVASYVGDMVHEIPAAISPENLTRTGFRLVCNHFKILFVKKLLYMRKDWMEYTCQALILFHTMVLAVHFGTSCCHEKPWEQLTEIKTMNAMVWYMALTFILIFTSVFITFPANEHVSRFKHLQMMTGVSPVTYWLVCFVSDVVYYICIMFPAAFLILPADHFDMYSTPKELGTLISIATIYILTMCTSAYVLSISYPTLVKSTRNHIFGNLLIGTGGILILKLASVGREFLKPLMYLCPHCAGIRCFLKFSLLAIENNKCKLIPPDLRDVICNGTKSKDFASCCENMCGGTFCYQGKSYFVWSDEQLGEEICYLVLDFFLDLFLIFLVEYKYIRRIFRYLHLVDQFWKSSMTMQLTRTISKVVTRIETAEDDDVQEEKERVKRIFDDSRTVSGEGDSLLVHELRKKYKAFDVQGVSFGARKGECFGILGVAGSGKTSVARVLSGEELWTSGDAYLLEWKFSTDKSKFLSKLGYTPESDPLISIFTGSQMLQLMARLRGLPKDKAKTEALRWLSCMDMREKADDPSWSYSVGQKRKLSTAMAFVAHPPVVLLDGPTNWLDPVSRSHLLKIVQGHKQSGQTIVITSSSMEECEVLCDRIAIMASGKFKYFGSVKHLRTRFARGFTIVIKVAMSAQEEDIKEVKQTVDELLEECILKEEHHVFLSYELLNKEMLLSALFGTLETICKLRPLIDEYLVSQTTLEQVYLVLCRKHESASFYA